MERSHLTGPLLWASARRWNVAVLISAQLSIVIGIALVPNELAHARDMRERVGGRVSQSAQCSIAARPDSAIARLKTVILKAGTKETRCAPSRSNSNRAVISRSPRKVCFRGAGRETVSLTYNDRAAIPPNSLPRYMTLVVTGYDPDRSIAVRIAHNVFRFLNNFSGHNRWPAARSFLQNALYSRKSKSHSRALCDARVIRDIQSGVFVLSLIVVLEDE